MPLLKKIKDLIANYNFEEDTLKHLKELEEYADCEYFDGMYTRQFENLTGKVLADSLHYLIRIRKRRVPESEIAPGSSKFGGIPHLPTAISCPEGYRFYAQLNIADFKLLDIENEFPDKGIIYFFDNADGEPEDFKVCFHEGDLTELINVTPAPSAFSYLVNFIPHGIFYLTDYSEILTILPHTLKAEIEDRLGCKLKGEDECCRIFGRPVYWQSEDLPHDDEPEAAAGLKDLMLSISPFDQQQTKSESMLSKEDRILFFHNDYADGSIHFWISRQDLKNKRFDRIEVGYSGT